MKQPVREQPTREQPTRRLWRLLSRAFLTALLLLIGYLVITRLAAIDWREVARSIADYDPLRVLLALLCVAVSYAACASYDLISRHVLGLSLPARQVAAKSFVGYAFSMNLGAMLGGMGARYRLYSRAGVPPGDIVRLMMLGSISNWVGYALLAGILLWQVPPELITALDLPPGLLGACAIALMSITAAYLLLCTLRRGAQLPLRGVSVPVPRLRVALLQLSLSLLSWSAIISALQVLMPAGIVWVETARAVAVGAVAGAVSHVPGGIGVLEYVFVEMLEGEATAAAVLAAVVVYRALYYVLPFLLALGVFGLLEYRLRGRRTQPA